MNDAPLQPVSASDSERLLVLLAYGLMMIAMPMGGVSALIGVVIAHIRLGHVPGSLFESHYRNQIRVFWTMLVFFLAAVAVLSIVAGEFVFSLFWPWFWPWHSIMLGGAWMMLGWLAGIFFLGLVIWYYWRLITGFVRMLDDRPY